MTTGPLDERSRALRRVVVAMLRASRRGHLGAALSVVEILRVLYDDVLSYRPSEPGWPGRDRCILSKGHGCLALYAVLYDKGFFPEAELGRFCKAGGILGGHPDHLKVPGVEASTGSLGHGLSIGVGFALNARLDRADYRTFVVLGDGECDEGSVWEAAMAAGKHRLASLTAIVDYNKLQSYGPTREVQDLEPFLDKWRSFGFAADEVDGHDVTALGAKLRQLPFAKDRPSALICHTVKGRGAPCAEHNLSWHHKTKVTDEELRDLTSAFEAD